MTDVFVWLLQVISAQPVVRQNVYLNVKPPNYLVMSVIVLFFFCWIFGLIALFTSLQVRQACRGKIDTTFPLSKCTSHSTRLKF